ncbi:MAG: PEP-CTERM sorting domain-containing protein [Planctomycetales bacterium]|nr:PEP-CTERM sorting domain-containing protein [Planctomycetales bacterium]
MTRSFLFLLAVMTGLSYCGAAWAQNVLYSENFEGVGLGPNVEEGLGDDDPRDEVWNAAPPEGWTVDLLDTPVGGVTEWRGWNFVDPIWWSEVAGQDRGNFSNGTEFVVAVADGDEWDDKTHEPGAMNTLLSTPPIDVTGLGGGADLSFMTSWRADNCCGVNQTATITASFDGGAPVEILRWESDPESDYFQADLNDFIPIIEDVPVDIPNGAQEVVFNFGYVGGNNWWWAIDNIEFGDFTEDFESVTLGPNVDEGRSFFDPDATVWSPTGPEGWTVENQVPGQDEEGDFNGVQEWIGWTFANKDWWVQVAGDQRRSEFTLGEGTVMIADPDEWDDAAHPDSASEGWYNTDMSLPPISLEGVEEGSVEITFDSSWRPEFDDNYQQSGRLTVSFDGGAPVELFTWLSDPDSPLFKDDNSTNETLTYSVPNPAGASEMVFTFSMFDAGNDWWWAVDNVVVTGSGGGGGLTGDFNNDGVVTTADLDVMVLGNAAYDVTGDGNADAADVTEMVSGLINTWIGDSNGDGEFSSGDFVQVFGIGKFETGQAATWSEGDWNLDGVFDTSDFVAAFTEGGYELGPKAAVSAVPEPSTVVMLLFGLLPIGMLRRRS